MDLREKRADLSLPRPPAPGLASWKETGRTLGRAISLSVWSGMAAWRWLLLVPVFGVGAVIIKDILRFFFEQDHISRRVDAWDLFPAMLIHVYFLHLLFGFGFMLLIGDSYRREQEQGSVALSVVRMPSRSLYWLGKMGAVGVMALGFVGLGLAITLIVGMVIAPPQSVLPMLPREAVAGMYPQGALPVPVYIMLLAGYTAWALWVVGCAAVLLSLFIPHKVGVLVAIAFWTLLSLSWDQPSYMGYARLLSLGYFIGFFKHQIDEPIPLGPFFAITAAALVLMAIAGARRLRREEL